MISEYSYSKDWLDNLRVLNKKIDPSLCEKMIRALGLLEALVTNKLDFVFKGGTSLILLIEKPERFSIDIDINTTASKDEVEKVIESLSRSSLFKRFIEKERPDRGIPKAHYYFYYDSVVSGNETYVMLDVLFEEHSYSQIIDTPIKSHWIKSQGKPVTVKTPDIDSLLGDKLTVFAPNSTGIPYNIGKSMEIIKQLFDIGRLFDHFTDLDTVRKSFNKIAAKELEYRKLEQSKEDVLDDIIETSLLVTRFPGGKKNDYSELKELLDGLKRFKSYPIAVKYRADDAIISASKAAYLAVCLKSEKDKIDVYSKDAQQAVINFQDKFEHISKLKRRLPEAYYYWSEVARMINDT